MDYYRSEIKTGIIVVICVVILIFATFYVGGTNMFGSTYTVNVIYKNIGGLELDAPVYYAGLEAGKVKEMRILTRPEKDKFPGNTVMVNILVDKLAQIKKDSKVSIKTIGFMGLKYIDITPGSENAETMSQNTIVMGETSQDINEVMESVGQIVDQIKPRTGSIIAGLDNIAGENGTLQATITDLHKFINNADDVIVINKDDIKKIISNLSSATESLKLFANDIKEHPWKLLIKSSGKSRTAQPKKSIEQRPNELKSFGPRRTRQ